MEAQWKLKWKLRLYSGPMGTITNRPQHFNGDFSAPKVGSLAD